MPTFDVVSDFDQHELANAVDQANREVGTRYDFKGSETTYTLTDKQVTMQADSDFQLQQMLDILQFKLTKRGIDIACMDVAEIEKSGKQVKQNISLRQGVDADQARSIVKLIKGMKVKAQAAIQGEQVRVTAKKRDDLQAVIAMLKQADIDLPLQFTNFRD